MKQLLQSVTLHTPTSQFLQIVHDPNCASSAITVVEKITPLTTATNYSANMSGTVTCLSAYLSTHWIIDTGASHHMACSKSFFSTLTPQTDIPPKTLPTGERTPISHWVYCLYHHLDNVLYVPSFNLKLLSISQLTQLLHRHFSF
jgi:hypothetical protein